MTQFRQLPDRAAEALEIVELRRMALASLPPPLWSLLTISARNWVEFPSRLLSI